MGLADLAARLERDADARVGAIRARARADVEAVEVEAQRSTLQSREDARTSARRDRRARLARELAAARLSAQEDELRAQHAVIERILARTRELFDGALGDGAYLAALPGQVEDALRYVADRPVLLRCHPSLLPVVQRGATSESCTCEGVPGMPIGVTLSARDGSVDIDDTLAARLERLRARLSVALLARLGP